MAAATTTEADSDETPDLTKKLPEAVCRLIFSFLPLDELTTARAVCRRWNIFIDSDIRWQALCEEMGMESRPNDNFPWRHVYFAAQRVARNFMALDSNYKSTVLKGGHKDELWTMDLRGDVLVTGSSDRTLKVLNTKTLSVARTLAGHEGAVWAVDVDRINGLVVSGDTDGFVRVWDLESGELRTAFQAHHATVASLQVDDGLVITGAFDNSIAIHDLSTGRLRQVLQGTGTGGHKCAIWTVRHSHGKLVSGGWDCKVKLWSLNEGRGVRTFKGHTAPVRALEFDGVRVVSASWDQTVRLWDASSTEKCVATLSGHTGPVVGLAADSRRIVSGSYDGTVKIWSLVGAGHPPCVRTIKANKGGVLCVRMDWRRIYAGGKDGKVKVIDFSNDFI
eukprot:a845055_8.p1 GENE.a845055_8~~a845055_8.p1  ORF type:complete len:423 (-),score=162.15 a845055_8:18-1193(-)